MKSNIKILALIFLLAVFTYGFHLFSKNGDEPSASNNKVLENDGIVLPDVLLDSKGNEVSVNILKDKYVGLYFSASWCGPCRSFTPKLIDFKNKHADNFEVVLIGSDGSAKAQQNYMKKYKMPWLALINQSAPARKISSQLEVEFIPYLVVLNQDGKVLTKNGKNDVARLGEKAFSFWQQIEEN